MHDSATKSIAAKGKEKVPAERAISSPWTLSSPYWIIIAGEAAGADSWQQAARHAGLQPIGKAGMYAIQTAPEWVGEWERVQAVLHRVEGVAPLRAAIIASDRMPEEKEIAMNLRPLPAVQEVVEHLWLLDHLSEDRLVCYLQRVVDRRGKNVGYEAFARIQPQDQQLIGGAAIMRASHALKVEYQVDRRMHKVAIDNFAACDLEGYLFVNFLTGFIHRPEVYLDGLSQAVSRHGITPRCIALDVPLADYVRDLTKLRSIADYCRTRGFSLALDDVKSAEGLAPLLAELRPAFVKLDAKLAATLSTSRAAAVQEIIHLAHAHGASVLAEGVEDEAQYKAYMAAGVDLFQGYHFGAPERMDRPRGK